MSRRWLITVAMVLMTLFVMIEQARTVNPRLCEVPKVQLGEMSGFSMQVMEPSPSELESLPSDTQFVKRHYTAPNGTWFQVSAVIGGRSKSSIHRPELCLPSQGFQMMAPHTLTVGGRDWHAMTLARQNAPALGFAYTFYNQEGFRTSSHIRRIFRDVLDRSLRSQIDRWVMVTVNSSEHDDARLRQFLAELGRQL